MSVTKKLSRWSATTPSGVNLTGLKTELDTSKPVLVFFHGNGFSPLTYEPLFNHLSDDYHFYLLELQGHGEMPAGERFLGWDYWAGVFAEHLSELAKDYELIGSGHSFGGVIASVCAGLLPQLFSRLYLFDPIYLPKHMTAGYELANMLGLMRFHPMVKKTRNRRDVFSDKPSVIAAVRGKGVFKGWLEESLDSYAEHSFVHADDVQLRTPVWLECAIYASYSKRIYADVAAMELPVKLYHGAATYPYQIKEIERIGRLKKNFDVTPMQGGHCFLLENPARLAEDILRTQER